MGGSILFSSFSSFFRQEALEKVGGETTKANFLEFIVPRDFLSRPSSTSFLLKRTSRGVL